MTSKQGITPCEPCTFRVMPAGSKCFYMHVVQVLYVEANTDREVEFYRLVVGDAGSVWIDPYLPNAPTGHSRESGNPVDNYFL